MSGTRLAAILDNSDEADGFDGLAEDDVVMEWCVTEPDALVVLLVLPDVPNALADADPKPIAARLNMSYALLVDISEVVSRFPPN